MSSVRWRLRCLWLGGAVVLLGAACQGDCNDIGCNGGFHWIARTGDEQPLGVGTYAFELTLDDVPHAVTCTITEPPLTSACDEPATPDEEFALSVRLRRRSVDDAVDGFEFLAILHASSGIVRETRGPQHVSAVVWYEGELIVDVSYDVTYERDHTHYGDERCGYCDLQQAREVELGGSPER
jgi:hypothetical protein